MFCCLQECTRGKEFSIAKEMGPWKGQKAPRFLTQQIAYLLDAHKKLRTRTTNSLLRTVFLLVNEPCHPFLLNMCDFIHLLQTLSTWFIYLRQQQQQQNGVVTQRANNNAIQEQRTESTNEVRSFFKPSFSKWWLHPILGSSKATPRSSYNCWAAAGKDWKSLWSGEDRTSQRKTKLLA